MRTELNLVILSFGANLEDPQLQIERAYELVESQVGHILKRSSFYQTEAWGFKSESKFVNTVILIESKLDLEPLLNACKKIEKVLGRKPKTISGYESRLIDIDIVDFSGVTYRSENLIVPHEFMHERSFVLEPLKEILPNWKHPIFNKNCHDLLGEISKV